MLPAIRWEAKPGPCCAAIVLVIILIHVCSAAEITSAYAIAPVISLSASLTRAYDGSSPPVSDPNLEWASYLGYNSYGTGIAVDAAGDVWVAGYTVSTAFTGQPGGFVARITSGKQLAWVTYLGSWQCAGIAIDGAGNAWVAGSAYSQSCSTPGGFDTTIGGTRDAFVARITPSGALAWASFLGGSGSDYGCAIAIDALDNVWVTGRTDSADFPTTGAFQGGFGGERDSFVARITPAGTLAWASFLGGTGRDEGSAIATDAFGNAWVTGYSASPDFPTPGGFRTGQENDGWDAFVARVTPAGTLAWASLLGGAGQDDGCAIAIDAFGNAWVTGGTSSPDFPVPGGFLTVLVDEPVIYVQDAFVAKITPSGSLAWASYLAGNESVSADSDFHTVGNAITIDASGNVWVAGTTDSVTFPTPGGFQTSLSSDPYDAANRSDAFIVQITPQGTLAWGSYFGGWNGDSGRATTLDGSGNLWLTGTTCSYGIATPDAFQTDNGGDGPSDPLSDAYVAEIAACTSRLRIAALNPLPAAMEGRSYSGTLSAEGGTPPYEWSVVSGNLPAGLSLSASTGLISGTPTLPGMSVFAVRVADGTGLYALKPLSIVVNRMLAVSTACLSAGEVGTAYSQALAAVGGTPPCVWSVSPGTLPDGLTLNASTGVIGGTPLASGQWDFAIEVADSASTPGTATASMGIDISPDTTWLEIDGLAIGLSSKAGYDSLAVRGTFNMRPGIDMPQTVTLTVGDWSMTMDDSTWKESAVPGIYTWRQGKAMCRLGWRMNRTSKCVFRLSARRQTIRGLLPDLPNVKVRFQAGAAFDEEVTVVTLAKRAIVRLASASPPDFRMDGLVINRNLLTPHHDSCALHARLLLAEDFDPARDAISVGIGTYAFSLPEGTMPAAVKGIIQYSAPTGPDGSLTVRLDTGTHVLAVAATGVDLSSVANATRVSLAVTNHAGAVWDRELYMVSNKAGTVYRY